MLVNMKEMLEKARHEKYAVGQFNINNLEWIEAILDKANELRSPVILGVSANAAKYMGGWKVVMAMISAYIEEHDINIPVAVHVDHASSFEVCKAAIDAGLTSVMIDASKKPFAENIEITKRVVEYAHSRHVTVESELGKVGGQEDDVVAESMYADPEECRQMVDLTGIDALAPALGSVHGPYHGEPKLGFTEMKKIKELVSVPLVLHGGSGIPDEKILKAIECGTCKINVNTECQMAWVKIVREELNRDPDLRDPRFVIGPGKKGIMQVVDDKCHLFGSVGKA